MSLRIQIMRTPRPTRMSNMSYTGVPPMSFLFYVPVLQRRPPLGSRAGPSIYALKRSSEHCKPS